MGLADRGLPALPPSSGRLTPAQRLNPRAVKAGVPPTSFLLPPQTLQARALYNRHFISGWNAVNTQECADRTGGLRAGGQAWETGPQAGFLPLSDAAVVLMSKDMKSGAGGGGRVWRRGNWETRSPEFNKFGKRILKVR